MPAPIRLLMIEQPEQGQENCTNLEIILFKTCDVLPPKDCIFVHWGPIKMAEEDFLFVFVKGTQFLNVLPQPFFQLI